MQITCLQCGHHFKGKFCPNCGQKATVQRLSASVLLEEILHFVTHLDNGFPFTTWNFLIRPGITSLNYIAGKRKNYQKPVSYFLIWLGVYILLHNSLVNHFHYQLGREVVEGMNVQEQSNMMLRNHLSIFILPVLFVSSVIVYFLLARPDFNFVELFTLCLYGAGTYFMMLLVSDLILGFFLRINVLELNVFLWQTTLASVYNFWFGYDVYRRLQKRYFWIRLILVSVLIALSGLFIMFYLPMAWIYLRTS
jgi:hypothetical protein